MTNLISIADVTSEKLQGMVTQGVAFNALPPDQIPPLLRDKLIGLYFSKSSTRTQAAFKRAIQNFNGETISYTASDLQMSSGESLNDTGSALGLYLDMLVMRTNEDPRDMYAISQGASLPVINALCHVEHPTQAIADLITLEEHFGKLQELRILYVGAANNTMHSLALASCKIPGMQITLLTPSEFSLGDEKIARLHAIADENGSKIRTLDCPKDIEEKFDVVYTTRWASMGVIPDQPNWLKHFDGFKVDQAFLDKTLDQNTGVFMHDLPADRESEVCSDVLDGEKSIIWKQASNKMTAAMVSIHHCLAPVCDEGDR